MAHKPKSFVSFNLLFLVFSSDIKTDLNQINDNLNETSIQNALHKPV